MMKRVRRATVGVVAAAVVLSGCSGSIPMEPVPPGWTLNVHQPGEWWTQPLIPRSVVVQRCPPRSGWSSDPNLLVLTALPPGTSVEFSLWTDDYHCDIGWSQPVSEVTMTAEELSSEAGVRRLCSAPGLPMDAGWRYLGKKTTERRLGPQNEPVTPLFLTAAFIDEFRTVVACSAADQGELLGEEPGKSFYGSTVQLSVGADLSGPGQVAACPVLPSDLSRTEAGTVDTYSLRGAGAVRGTDGRVLTDAATLEVGLVGDSVTTRHPVVDGVAIVNASVRPTADIHFEWEKPVPLEGTVLDSKGRVLATCRG